MFTMYCLVSRREAFPFSSLLTYFLLLCKLSSVVPSGIYTNTYPYRGNARHPITILYEKAGNNVVDSLKELDELFSKCNGIDIRELTILEVQYLFSTNQLSSFTLTNCYLDRIHHMNHVLRAVIQVNPDAIKQAARADLKRAKYGHSNMLLGIPIFLKDNVDTKDFMETTAGALALLGIKPKNDSAVVAILRKAGAVILGKANLSEWAYFRGTDLPSGWSGRGGQTKNAYNLNATPMGSSSGSAQAVAANMAMVSIGTETDGSLIAPASVGGICTIKPTIGHPTTKGVIPLSHSQDHVGPMTRTVIDLAIFLDAIDPVEKKISSEESYARSLLSNNQPSFLRVGVPRYPFWNSSVLNSADLEYELPYLDSIVGAMKSIPLFRIVDPLEYPRNLLRQVTGANELVVFLHDFKYDLNNYLRKETTSTVVPRKIRTLQDIIKFNIAHPSPEGYNQDLLIMADATDGLKNRTYLEAKQKNYKAAKQILDYMLIKHNLDAVIAPSEPRIVGYTDGSDSVTSLYSLAACAGYPSVNIPAGIGIDGVPFGLSFIGLPHTERRLLQIAHAVEQLFPRRQKPLFLS